MDNISFFLFQYGSSLQGDTGAQYLKRCSLQFSLLIPNSGKTYDEVRAATACKSMNACCF